MAFRFSRPTAEITAAPKNVGQTDSSTPPRDSVLPPHESFAQGEERLMYAVLEDAVRCFEEGELTADRHKKRLAREAEEWIRADDISWPFSFENVCAHLGLDAEYMRRGLTKFKKRLLLQERLSPGTRSKRLSAAYGRAMPLSLGRS